MVVRTGRIRGVGRPGGIAPVRFKKIKKGIEQARSDPSLRTIRPSSHVIESGSVTVTVSDSDLVYAEKGSCIHQTQDNKRVRGTDLFPPTTRTESPLSVDCVSARITLLGN